MARLVVLRFENDEDAQAFVDTYSGYGSDDIYNPTIEMMVQTPTKFCDCISRDDGYRRGPTRGWLIHSKCGKPRQQWAENPRAVIVESVDLLEKSSGNTGERIQAARSTSSADNEQRLHDPSVDVLDSDSLRPDSDGSLNEVDSSIPVATNWPTRRDES
jgi:hypothetical protein